jgi:membrane-bound metal-dependent hydrolase YbcI (DUF457 family)
MTPVAHSLVGASLGIVALPALPTRRARAAFVAGFVVLASVPDVQVPYWGHGPYYHVSHSLFVNALLIFVTAACLRLWPRTRATLGSPLVLAAGATAWLSHLLLDSFYSHGRGVPIFWPFSDHAALVLPIPSFDVLRGYPSWLSAHNVRVCLIELACYSPLLLAALWWHYRRRAQCHAASATHQSISLTAPADCVDS